MVFQAGQGELTAKINADASGFRSGIQSATAALGGFRGALGIASGAVVAFAGAQGLMSAVQSAAQFEEQMLSLRSTVGESQQNIESIRESTMDLAADTGQATSQITDGWRFARSAGLEMAEAQELVETATKASAAGFGEQNELVRTATTAMNTWSSEVQSGSEFLDTMTSAAQNADIRVSEMAGAFRRNVNIASQLNLSLEETLGSLSAISGAVGSASRGGRLFQQVLAGLLKPTQQASDVISSAVGSVDNLHQTIREDGLVQALLQLQSNLEANGQGMDDVFRSTRRLEGALALISDEGGRARDIMGQLDNTSGNVQDAFENTDGTLRRWRQTQQEFNNLMIELGDDILPTVNSTLDVAVTTVNNFGEAVDAAGNLWNAFTSGIEDATVRETLDDMAGLSQETVDSFAQLQGVDMNPLAPGGGETIDINQTEMVATFKALARNIPREMRDDFAREFEAMVIDSTRDMEVADFSAMIPDLRDMRDEFVRRAEAAKFGVQESGIFKDPFAGETSTGDFGFGNVLEEETEQSTKQGIEDGMSQAEFSDQFASGLRSSIENSVRPTLEQFQQQDAGALFDPFGDPQEQRDMLEQLKEEGGDAGGDFGESFRDEFDRKMQQLGPLAQNAARDMNRAMSDTFFKAMQGEFDSLEDAGESFARNLATSLSRSLSQNLSRQIMGSILPGGGAGGGANIGNQIGGMFLEGVSWFMDTPGVQEVGKDGALTGFAPGDKFAAAQSMEDLRAQVGAGQQGQGVSVQESTTVQFNVEAVDAESVSRLFQQRSDELAGIITDNIDRRGQVQKAIEGASR